MYTVLEDEQDDAGLLGFALAFGRLAIANTFVFNANSSDFRLRDLLFVVVVLFVDQVCNQFVQAMRNSEQRVRIVFVHRFNSEFHSVFTLQTTGCDFQYVSNFWCSLESNLSGQLICRLVVTKTHDMSMALQIVRTRQKVLS